MKYYQKSYVGNGMIEKYVLIFYGKIIDFKCFVYFLQLMQVMVVFMVISGYCINMLCCSGMIYWQFNDCWLVLIWLSIDYYGNWKVL